MAKTKISEFDTNPDNNTDIDNINIAENCPPANINNAIRELMSQLKDFQAGNQASNQLLAAGGGTGLSSSGTSGNVLTSDGSGWVSSAPVYVPTGAILMWGTASAPTGYFLCNGAAINRVAYSNLFAIIGTSYGSGDGSTTFNLPDFRDRFPVGAGTTYSANSTGGSKDAIVVSHTHSVTDPGHTHSYFIQRIDTNFNLDGARAGVKELRDVPDTTGSQTTGISISTTGSSGTNANLPPYLGVYFIIKT
jgi:microcystin-dependent protein